VAEYISLQSIKTFIKRHFIYLAENDAVVFIRQIFFFALISVSVNLYHALILTKWQNS